MIRPFLMLAAALMLATPAAHAQSSVPVTVETDGQLDPCGLGRVARLNPQGDGFLAVRTGPGTRYAKVNELYNGDEVWICVSEGRWHGVVYPARDCGLSDVIGRVVYRGPCNSGLVHSNWVDWIAG